MSALRQAREACGLSAADVSRLTRLSPRVVAALDDERYDELPAGIYARMAVRAYARAVGLNPLATLRELEPLLPVATIDLAVVAALRAPAGKRRAIRYALAAGVDAMALVIILGGILVVCGAACEMSSMDVFRTAPGSMMFLWSIVAVLYFGVLGATDVRTAGPWLLDVEILQPARQPIRLDELPRRALAYVTAECTLILSSPLPARARST